MQIGNKTECALLGLVIDLGVDYRQVGWCRHVTNNHQIFSLFSSEFFASNKTISVSSFEKKCLTHGSEKSTLLTRPENP